MSEPDLVAESHRRYEIARQAAAWLRHWSTLREIPDDIRTGLRADAESIERRLADPQKGAA